MTTPPSKSMGDIFNERRQAAAAAAAAATTSSTNNNNTTPSQSSPPTITTEGTITSLLDSYGFISLTYPPSHPPPPSSPSEDAFFHYSEVISPEDKLTVGAEVKFLLVVDEEGCVQNNNRRRLSARRVQLLPHPIRYDVELYDGERKTGYVERSLTTTRDNNNNRSSSSGYGLIRLNDDDGASGDDNNNASNVVCRFFEDEDNAAVVGRLRRGDYVDGIVMWDKRRGKRYLRDVTLLKSEREEREEMLLKSATSEEGIVISWTNDYGFLRSTSRPDDIYCHISHIDSIPPLHAPLSFLVVDESSSDDEPSKWAARQVKRLPSGSIPATTTIAEGVEGIVSIVPTPPTPTAREIPGMVTLTQPLSHNDGAVTSLQLSVDDAPGGTFSLNRDGTHHGLWIRNSDKLTFDVIFSLESNKLQIKNSRLIRPALAGRCEGIISALRDGFGFVNCAERNVDAYFRTYELLPPAIQCSIRGSDEELEASVGMEVTFDLSYSYSSPRAGKKKEEKENLKARRLCLLPKGSIVQSKPLASGVPATVTQEHNDGSGFVTLEEPVRGFELVERHPIVAQTLSEFVSSEEKTMVYPDVLSAADCHVIVSLSVLRGLETSFVIHKEGRYWLLDALPEIAVANGGRLRVSKPIGEDDEEEILEVFPLDNNSVPFLLETTTTDQQSFMGEISIDNTSVASSRQSGGALTSFAGSSNASSRRSKKSKKKKVKPVRVIRYEREDLASSELLGMGDIVSCDVVQYRRTGAYAATKVVCTQRKLIERAAPAPAASPAAPVANDEATVVTTGGSGRVAETVPHRHFGFISYQNNENQKEMLFFHTSSITKSFETDRLKSELHALGPRSRKRGQLKQLLQSGADMMLHKGDDVTFDIGEQENGKRVALNIHIIGRASERMKKEVCEGIVLMEPSHTTIEEKSKNGNGKWDVMTSPAKGGEGAMNRGEGRVLLTSDPQSYYLNKQQPKDDNDQPQVVGILHLTYKNDHIAPSLNPSPPRRGDLIQFTPCQSSSHINISKIVKKGAYPMVKGHLEGLTSSSGIFVPKGNTRDGDTFVLDLVREVVSCDGRLLKEMESVEGIIYDGGLHGVCRTSDLYLKSKNNRNSNGNQRPRLNLKVRRDMKGPNNKNTGMAKGPDGTNGFPDGWTKRVSSHTSSSTSLSAKNTLNANAKPFDMSLLVN